MQQVGQKTLGGGFKRDEEMRVGWGFCSCVTGGVGRVEGEKVLHVHE
jgi:hypothetical protein